MEFERAETSVECRWSGDLRITTRYIRHVYFARVADDYDESHLVVVHHVHHRRPFTPSVLPLSFTFAHAPQTFVVTVGEDTFFYGWLVPEDLERLQNPLVKESVREWLSGFVIDEDTQRRATVTSQALIAPEPAASFSLSSSPNG